MLLEITLHNVMSHKDTTLFFEKGLYLFTGENGDGKSTIFESLVFAFFGVVRTSTTKGILRDGCTDMSVAVKLKLRNNKKITIIRGIKKEDKGYVEIYNAEETQPCMTGSSADDYIVTTLGITEDLFLLTSFFGMRASDNLLNVKPSERLETLQQIANIEVYKTMHSEVLKRQRDNKENLATVTAEIELLKQNEVVSIETSLTEARKLIQDTEVELDGLRVEKAHIATKASRTEALLNEKARLLIKVKHEADKKRDSKACIEDSKEDVAKLNALIQNIACNIKNTKQTTEGVNIDELEKAKDKLLQSSTRLEMDIQLRSTALKKSDTQKKCPLCHADLIDEIENVWKNEIETLTKNLNKVSQELVTVKTRIGEVINASKNLTDLSNKIDNTRTKLEGYQTDIETQTNIYKKALAEETKLNQRLATLEKEINTNDLKQEELIQNKIEACISTIAENKTKVDNLKEQKNKIMENRKKLEQKRKNLGKLLNQKAAYSILNDAFCRYGIPISLLSTLQTRLSEEATNVLNEFTQGQILVEDIEERGKPGIEFTLQKTAGVKRSYASLSDGERVIMYFSIRLALSRLLAEVRPNIPSFLVLDELTGHLSDKVRDNLTATIAKILRKEYIQIFITSHTQLRNIFDYRYNVVKTNDVSAVHLIE